MRECGRWERDVTRLKRGCKNKEKNIKVENIPY